MFSVLWHIRGSMVVIELISNQTDLQVGDGRGGSGRGCGRGGSGRGGRARLVKMRVCLAPLFRDASHEHHRIPPQPTVRTCPPNGVGAQASDWVDAREERHVFPPGASPPTSCF